MIPLWLALCAAPAAAWDIDDAEERGGFSLGYGRARIPDESWGWVMNPALRWDFYAEPLMGTVQGGLLFGRLPPEGMFYPEIAVSAGAAPWGWVGPRAALGVGYGMSLSRIEFHYSGMVGAGFDILGVDLRVRRGMEFRSATSGAVPLTVWTLEISLMPDLSD